MSAAAAAAPVIDLADDSSSSESSSASEPPRAATLVNAWSVRGTGKGLTDLQERLAAVAPPAFDLDTLHGTLRPWFAGSSERVQTVRRALQAVDSRPLPSRQVVALARTSRDASVIATAQRWRDELDGTRTLAECVDRALQQMEYLVRLMPQLEQRVATMVRVRDELERVSFPARPDSAAALIDAFQQRPTLCAETPSELKCCTCLQTHAELSADDASARLFRINPTCTMHAECAARVRLCACNIALCKTCVVTMMGLAYADQRAALELDGTGGGIEPARGALTCPQCKELFCFTDLQPLVPASAGKRATPPDADVEPAPAAKRRTRLRARVASDASESHE